jgi:hypothetical protein
MRNRWVTLATLVVLSCAGALCAAATASAGSRGADAPRTVPPPSTTPGAPGDSLPPDVTENPAPADDSGLPPAKGPLVVVPAGCPPTQPAVAVFEGRMVDAVASAAEFRVTRLLAGSLEGFEDPLHLVEVQYRSDTRFLQKFLHVGALYVVGVAIEPVSGLLASSIREPSPAFGGDAVIGVNDNTKTCPTLADPVRTVLPNGAPVDTGILTPLKGNGRALLLAVGEPVGLAVAVLVALVLLKHLLFGLGRSLGSLEPAPPRPARMRRHRPPSSGGEATA